MYLVLNILSFALDTINEYKALLIHDGRFVTHQPKRQPVDSLEKHRHKSKEISLRARNEDVSILSY